MERAQGSPIFDANARRTMRTGKSHLRMGATLSLLAVLIAVPAASLAQDTLTPILDRGEGTWTATVIADGLDYPWNLVRDGERLIVTEKAGAPRGQGPSADRLIRLSPQL
ncbi:hypothetical protein [Pleomorphomonas carboxyditropha]|uniref:hypothetical protein n=1 Tax=Pleomorphomonas carboxyditropha TaxID=2023338 RepID=UPI001FDEB171|nr:hypothetical protein [Pleomorphomonas carboxyditropha]